MLLFLYTFLQATNVALGGTASLSTTRNDEYLAEASIAIDGNTGGDYFSQEVASTASNQQGSWWKVDLGGLYEITEIKVYNREDCCQG